MPLIGSIVLIRLTVPQNNEDYNQVKSLRDSWPTKKITIHFPKWLTTGEPMQN